MAEADELDGSVGARKDLRGGDAEASTGGTGQSRAGMVQSVRAARDHGDREAWRQAPGDTCSDCAQAHALPGPRSSRGGGSSESSSSRDATCPRLDDG